MLSILALAATIDLAVPFVPQEKDTCGAAALAMVLRYWGRPVAHSEIASALAEPELRGIRGTRLAAFAREHGLFALAYEGDLAQLRDYVGKGRPLIVAWKVPSRCRRMRKAIPPRFRTSSTQPASTASLPCSAGVRVENERKEAIRADNEPRE